MNEQQLDRAAITSPDILTLREARRRAGEARAVAEQALREAEEAEAVLVAEEERAVAAAAAAARSVQLTEAARVAAEREHDAIERVAGLERELTEARQRAHDATLAREQADAELASAEAHNTRPPVVTDFATIAAQRAAERRSADAARARLTFR